MSSVYKTEERKISMNISKGTIIRTVCLVLAIVNNALAIWGKSPLPIDNEMVTEVISFAFTVAASLAAWWKNNSFTQAAIEADEYMKERKVELIEWDI
jgi:SPP1 family holin